MSCADTPAAGTTLPLMRARRTSVKLVPANCANHAHPPRKKGRSGPKKSAPASAASTEGWAEMMRAIFSANDGAGQEALNKEMSRKMCGVPVPDQNRMEQYGWYYCDERETIAQIGQYSVAC